MSTVAAQEKQGVLVARPPPPSTQDEYGDYAYEMDDASKAANYYTPYDNPTYYKTPRNLNAGQYAKPAVAAATKVVAPPGYGLAGAYGKHGGGCSCKCGKGCGKDDNGLDLDTLGLLAAAGTLFLLLQQAIAAAAAAAAGGTRRRRKRSQRSPSGNPDVSGEAFSDDEIGGRMGALQKFVHAGRPENMKFRFCSEKAPLV